MNITYNFKPIKACNMCGTGVQDFSNLGIRLNQSQGLTPKKKSGIAVSVKKCNNCNLVFADPQPLPNSIMEQYDIAPEEYWKSNEFHWDETYFHNELKILKSLQKPSKEMKALDVGAGYGRCLLSLEKAGYESHGFEPSKPFYDLAISKFGINRERIRLSTMEEIDYPENFFDFITFGAVLEHLHDPNECLKKAVKWLKPGGLIHVEVPSSNWFVGKLINFYLQTIKRTNYVTNTSPMHAPFHHFEFTQRSFQENGKLNNYSIVYDKIEVCDTMLPIKTFDGVLKQYMKWTNTGMQLIIFLRKNG